MSDFACSFRLAGLAVQKEWRVWVRFLLVEAPDYLPGECIRMRGARPWQHGLLIGSSSASFVHRQVAADAP